MQSSESQTATMSETLRFSYLVVPLGYVPSTGSALTGSSIAEAGHHRRRHGAHELRSVGGYQLARLAPRRGSVGDLNLVQGGDRAVDRLDVALHDLATALAVGLL